MRPIESFQSHKYYTIHPPSYDGFGAQYHAILSGIAYSASNNLIYVHTPLRQIAHGGNVKQLNEFIGIEAGTAPDMNPMIETHSEEVHFSERPSKYYTPEVIKTIRDYYYSSPKPIIEQNDIAVHIRRGDVIAGDAKRYTTNQEYKAILDTLQKEYPTYKITIHSQGNLNDFSELLGENISCKLNEDIRVTFHSLVTAKVLVLAKSSLSYSAGILNEGTVYYQEFWHKPLNGWKRL